MLLSRLSLLSYWLSGHSRSFTEKNLQNQPKSKRKIPKPRPKPKKVLLPAEQVKITFPAQIRIQQTEKCQVMIRIVSFKNN